ncbi:MAG: hypothetical protein C4539_18395 [Ignavibacteriales bacterium]|nr:MAG: hypothetical protein C4539_18395 [Ignavibacteriales bacterium]
MSDIIKKYYYLTPLLLSILVFASNFLETRLFSFGDLNFAVWFVLSLFCFACGWLINSTFGWKRGGRIVFAMIVATAVISVVMLIMFREYFSSSQTIAENLILYSLRNVTLGCMSFFGMAVKELLSLQKEISNQSFRLEAYEQMVTDAKKESELVLKEAKLNAEKLIREAENLAKSHLDKKEKIEKELKEFIHLERELIKKYEERD